ncbi:MAG TPA: hypothetical protein VGY14_00920 [Methyloceanibacter sp.]|nr:hypothetical protein [Methyloceanibacter sp.]
MQPIHENGGPMYFLSMYDKDGDRPKVAARLGNAEKGDGVRFHGRGYVQLKGRTNYRKAGKLVDLDLLGDPNLARSAGMEAGLFTTKKFGDYFNTPPRIGSAPAKSSTARQGAADRRLRQKFYSAISYTTGP